MESIWKVQKSEGPVQELKSHIERDIVIVGGGIAGVLCAYRLAKRGEKVTLIEANTLYSGVTQNTTAHITALQGCIYSKIKKAYSPEIAKLYFDSQQKAIDDYEKLVKSFDMNCDFIRQNAYLYTNGELDKLKEEYEAFQEFGADADIKYDTNLIGFPVKGVIHLANQAAFDPIKFLEALPKKFEIIENTRILDIDTERKILYTKYAKISAKKIVIASGYPIVDIPGWNFIKMYKSQSYAIACENVADIGGCYQGVAENGLTFRNYKDKLIVGGLDHRTGRTNNAEKFARLEEITKNCFPDAKITHKWAANDCITFDGIPFIGKLSKSVEDVYIVTGFNKWGMTNAMAASQLIYDLITKKTNEYEELFSPQRKKTGTAGAFISNLFSIIKNLIIMPVSIPFHSVNSLQNGSGGVVRYKGKKQAVYKDENGKLFICKALCSHLKCQLTFNPNTITWDCPCHGSRFDINGNIIVSPAVKNLGNKEI